MSRVHAARRRRDAWVLAFALLLPLLLPGGDAVAQDEGMSRQQQTFQPVLFVLGSTSDNEFRSSGEPVSDASLYAELDLPFAFRGPRWAGGFSLRPSMRKYRDQSGLDDWQGAGDVWLSGALGPRTELDLRADAAFTPELSGFDDPDLITPRADRLRTRAQVDLSHRLSRVDSLSLGAEYDRSDYRNNEFEGVQQFGLTAGFSRGLSRRFAATMAVRGDRLLYESGGSADALAVLAGFAYDLGPRTEIEMRGGPSWITGERGTGADFVDLDRRSVFVDGRLRHSGQYWVGTLRAERRLASGTALGQPTLRTQGSGALQLAGLRWRLGVVGGFARNELLDDDLGVLIAEDGSAFPGDRVDTWSGCVDAGYRVTRWLSVVGSGRAAHQRSTGVGELLDIDVYRLSLGFGLHPAAPSVRPRSGSNSTGIQRYRRFATLGSC